MNNKSKIFIGARALEKKRSKYDFANISNYYKSN